VEKIQTSFKSDKNNGSLLEDLCAFMVVLCLIPLTMRNVSKNNRIRNKLILFSKFFSLNLVFYEIM
jgi:hypothetical protein